MRLGPQAATLWHSSAQALQASPHATHSEYCGNLSHSFLQARQMFSTTFASAGTAEELTAAKRRESAASGDRVEGGLSAGRHARVVHGQHAETVTQAIVALEGAFAGGVAQSLVFGRMHVLDAGSAFGQRRHG